jgi:DNA-binding winged helix-turn-helix (wHTH) protein/tetratricopeptide (TPR) repeat protein
MSSSTAAASADTLFGSSFELRLHTREVITNGVLQKFERRAFDLLVYLIENRDRVVSRDELLQKVWGTTHLSASALPQAIVKVRRMLGDERDEPQLIKTIHRVGYRFIGHVRTVPGPIPDEPTAPARVLPEKGRVAFLPVELRDAGPELQWVEFGLVALVINAMADRGLQLLSMGDTIVALTATDPSLPAEQKAELLCQKLGAAAVLAITVTRDGEEFRMNWRLLGSRIFNGVEVLGRKLPRMAAILGERAGVYLGAPTAAGATHGVTGEAFADEAFARASSAWELQDFENSWKLLQLCYQSRTPPLYVDAFRVRLMAVRGDADVLQYGNRVLERIVSGRDRMAEVTILVALSRYCSEAGKLAEADGYVTRAEHVLADVDDPVLRARVLLQAISVAYYREHVDDHAIAQCEQLRQLSPRLPLTLQLTVLIASATMLDAAGRSEEAILELRAAVEFARQINARYNLRIAVMNLAAALEEAGKLSEAHVEATEAVRMFQRHEKPAHLRTTALWTVFKTSILQSQVEAALACLETYEDESGDDDELLGSHVCFFRAFAAWRLGCFADAAGHLKGANLGLLAESAVGGQTEIPFYIGIILASAGVWSLFQELIEGAASRHQLSNRTGKYAHASALVEISQAIAEHAMGDVVGAGRRLEQVAQKIQEGSIRARALLLATWLSLEEDDVAHSRVLAAEAGNWLTGNPLGMIIHGRLELADGAFDAAAATIRVALAGRAACGPADQYFQHVLACAASSRRTVDKLPNLAWLL